MPRVATASEAHVAAEILAHAFARDPVVSSFLPYRPGQAARIARYFELESRVVFKGYGEVWLDDDLLGAAMWRKPGGYPEPVSVALPLVPRYLRLFPREFLRASRAMTALARQHPREPHWYLFAVGVLPEATGQGRGTRLLDPVLRRCDDERLPAYLEASTESNARLYERLGFENRGEFEILPGVPVRLMWREPR